MQPPFDPKQVPNLWQSVGELQDFVTKVHGSLQDPKKKQLLGELLDKLKTARADAEAIVPQHVEEMQKDAQKLQAELEELQRQSQQARAEADAHMNAVMEKQVVPPPAPPAVPDNKVELKSGGDLRKELLQAAGLPETATQKMGFDDAGSIARMWSETESGDHGTASAPTAAQPATPANPAARPTLKPRPLTPLRRPPQEKTPAAPQPSHDESIGKMDFEDE